MESPQHVSVKRQEEHDAMKNYLFVKAFQNDLATMLMNSFFELPFETLGLRY